MDMVSNWGWELGRCLDVGKNEYDAKERVGELANERGWWVEFFTGEQDVGMADGTATAERSDKETLFASRLLVATASDESTTSSGGLKMPPLALNAEPAALSLRGL